jgi:hypothetical protein
MNFGARDMILALPFSKTTWSSMRTPPSPRCRSRLDGGDHAVLHLVLGVAGEAGRFVNNSPPVTQSVAEVSPYPAAAMTL